MLPPLRVRKGSAAAMRATGPNGSGSSRCESAMILAQAKACAEYDGEILLAAADGVERFPQHYVEMAAQLVAESCLAAGMGEGGAALVSVRDCQPCCWA